MTTGVRITKKDGEWYIDTRVGGSANFKKSAMEHTPRAAINRAAEILGLEFIEAHELAAARREADMLRDALATVRSELGTAWPVITDDVMQRVEVVCDVVGVLGDAHRCSRCLKLVSGDGVHTCTPTARWLELERKCDKLLEFAKRISEQTPEKPDHWSSCGQCERNISDAEDAIASVKGGV